MTSRFKEMIEEASKKASPSVFDWIKNKTGYTLSTGNDKTLSQYEFHGAPSVQNIGISDWPDEEVSNYNKDFKEKALANKFEYSKPKVLLVHNRKKMIVLLPRTAENGIDDRGHQNGLDWIGRHYGSVTGWEWLDQGSNSFYYHSLSKETVEIAMKIGFLEKGDDLVGSSQSGYTKTTVTKYLSGITGEKFDPELRVNTKRFIKLLLEIHELELKRHESSSVLKKKSIEESLVDKISSVVWCAKEIINFDRMKNLDAIEKLSAKDKAILQDSLKPAYDMFKKAESLSEGGDIDGAMVQINVGKQYVHRFTKNYPGLSEIVFGSKEIAAELSKISNLGDMINEEVTTLDTIGSIEYKVNDAQNPSYFTAFCDGKKIAYLDIRGIKNVDGQKYLNIGLISVDKKFRKQGIATQLYRLAVATAKKAGMAGLYSYGPDVSSKAPLKIRRKLGGKEINGDEFVMESKLNEAYWENYKGITEVLNRYKNSTDTYISFSDVPKVGIHPSAGIKGSFKHHDPYGVYFYPLPWLRENVNFYTTFSDRPYILVAKVKNDSGVINLSRVTHDQAKSFLAKIDLDDRYEELFNFNKVQINDFLKSLYRNRENESSSTFKKPGSLFWRVLEEQLTKINYQPLSLWNTLFRRMGIWGVKDSSGIISHMETSQMIVLDVRKIKLLEIVDNKFDESNVITDYFRSVVGNVLDPQWKMQSFKSHHDATDQLRAIGTYRQQPLQLDLIVGAGMHRESMMTKWEARYSQNGKAITKEVLDTSIRVDLEYDTIVKNMVSAHTVRLQKSLSELMQEGPIEHASKDDELDAFRMLVKQFNGNSPAQKDISREPGIIRTEKSNFGSTSLNNYKIEFELIDWPKAKFRFKISVFFEDGTLPAKWVSTPILNGINDVKRSTGLIPELIDKAIASIQFPKEWKKDIATRMLRKNFIIHEDEAQ